MTMKGDSSVHSILILGGSFAGISEAHYLLRHVLPPLSAASSITYKVTLLAPSKYFYFKIGAPRAIVVPSVIPIEKQFVEISDGFKGYPASSFQYIQGAASSLDPTTKTVVAKQISEDGATTEKTISLTYDSLLIATGISQTSPLYTQQGSDVTTRSALKDIHKRLPDAKSVLVAGGGPAGTETAGELGSEYGKHTSKPKNLTILSGGERLLPRLRPSIGHEAETRLKGLGVNTIHNLRVTSAVDRNGQTELALSDGTTRTVDIYIPAIGDKPNTEFLPSDWLNDRGYVKTDPATLRVSVPGVSNVWALGSVASYSTGGVMDIYNAVRPLGETVRVDLFSQLPATAQAALEPKPHSFPFSLWKSAPPKASEHRNLYKQWTSEMQLVPIGRKQGVGALFGWKIPSYFVYLIKGKTFFLENAPLLVSGNDYKKA